MERKAFPLINQGMNRDLSISKSGESAAYENHNIRILATDHDTTLSVTNERGNKEIPLDDIEGILIGWNVLNEYVIIFTTEKHEDGDEGVDRIYRVKYNDDGTFELVCLYSGDLDFDAKHPIESVVYYETEKIQKIYWVDGKNVLRFMNFVADSDEMAAWSDGTYFDSNRTVNFGISVSIEKDNSGNPRPNGIVQYLITYFNKHGQESGYVWISDLVYLSPVGVGGSADSNNNNKVTLNISGLDSRFSHFRVYSVFRSSYDGTTVGYLVGESDTKDGTATVIDDGAHLTSIDSSSLLYLGSRSVIPGTLAHKDQTLFLGDLQSIGKKDYSAFEAILKDKLIIHDEDKEKERYSNCITFKRVEGIDYPENSGTYSYENQLKYTSSQITTFKGGELYRFALVFKDENGAATDAFWIGDAINPYYPKIENGKIYRVIAECDLSAVADDIPEDFKTVQLMIAEASYADRSVKAQGIINPTVFNVWNRYNNRLYSAPSWISRPRHSGFAWKHFEPIHNSTSSTGEIECNYWEEETAPTPYYNLVDNGNGDVQYVQDRFKKYEDWDYLMIVYGVECEKRFLDHAYLGNVTVIKANLLDHNQESITALESFEFKNDDFYIKSVTTNRTINYTDPDNRFTITYTTYGVNSRGSKKKKIWDDIYRFLTDEQGIEGWRVVDFNLFAQNWCKVAHDNKDTLYYFNANFDSTPYTDKVEILNHDNKSVIRWNSSSDDIVGSLTGAYTPSRMNKNFMFVDENILTLNSPEIEYENTSFDNTEGMKMRIVGVAKITGGYNDYIVDASHGKLAGDNLVRSQLTNSIDGITAWPLWREYGLAERLKDENGKDWSLPAKKSDYDSEDYIWGGSIVKYWLHAFSKTGKINGFTDQEKSPYSDLRSKTFANLRFSYESIFNDYNSGNQLDYDLVSLRTFNHVASQTVSVNVGNSESADSKFYDGIIYEALSMPSRKKYKILYSINTAAAETSIDSENCFLFSDTPVMLEYSSSPHAVLSLGSSYVDGKYVQTVLPKIFNSESLSFGTHHTEDSNEYSGPLIPWIDSVPESYNYVTGIHDDSATITFHVESPYNENSKVISLSYTGDLEMTSVISYVWSYGMKMFDNQSVYANILADDGYRYIVRINDYDYDGIIITLDSANVITRASEAGETIKVNRLYVNDSSSTQDDKVLIKNLDVWTKALTDVAEYEYIDYDVNQPSFSIPNGSLANTDRYLFIGEIYDPDMEHLYGGNTENAIENNKFISAGPLAVIGDGWNNKVIANEGDTYFQRWDCLKTKPYSNSSVNNVIDITSFMVETHINIDGRTDLQRGVNYLASIDYAQFGTLNRVYSQPDNFITNMDLDEDFNLDEYRSSITWTLQKADSADVDEWSHVTLASTLKLDGDKGWCRAIRRFQNSLIAFQDRGISEILFNSRTQLSTTDGVPVEIANSGKVDGKRYITNKFGCINKWSITEGKNALYFIDNVNKAFCAFSGSIENLSLNLGFDAWFKRRNSTELWNPDTYPNVVSYYDRIHSDVYLVSNDDSDNMGCLVYSEPLQRFSSFYDYTEVPMMVNVKDRFLSSKRHRLWLQNEGLYCNFFGQQYDFWMTYRVVPSPYSDKIWTNIEYRSDFFRVLDSEGTMEVSERDLIGGDRFDDYESLYQHNETFDTFKVWNEYQQTDEKDITRHYTSKYPDVRKKFRLWRLDVPRASKSDTNRFGLDRIRNPWVNVRFSKNLSSFDNGQNRDLMQMHDAVITYFE